MAHEDTVLYSLDKILDVIWREEGRLAVINRYGASLGDEDKVQATQLITSQKANMDRLFAIYKEELLPLMHSVQQNSEAMKPLLEKLMVPSGMTHEMNTEQNLPESNIGVPVSESAVAATDETSYVNNAGMGDVSTAAESVAVESATPVDTGSSSFVPETSSDGIAPISDSVSDTSVVIESTVAPGEFNLDAAAANNDVAGVSAPVESNTFVPDVNAPVAPTDNPLGSPLESTGDSVMSTAPDSGAGVVLSSMEEETPSSFVLSPIDEDVEPAVTEEETKKAEAGVEAANQQLGAIDAVKTDIMASTELTEEEKAEKLEQYIRMTDAAVKAILVTKAQCEKLLASRESQKTLLGVNSETAKTDVVDVVPGDVVATLPDFTAEDNAVTPVVENKVEGDVSPIVGTDDANAVAVVPAEGNAASDDVVVPMIGAGENPVAEAPAVASDPVASAQDNPNELQAMIEQANALYQEGKTAEAQALFDKIAAMNNGAQGGEAMSAPAEDAVVLVKK